MKKQKNKMKYIVYIAFGFMVAGGCSNSNRFPTPYCNVNCLANERVSNVTAHKQHIKDYKMVLKIDSLKSVHNVPDSLRTCCKHKDGNTCP